MITKTLNKIRIRRAARARAIIKGTAERPRLSVFRSNRFVYAQLIDDAKGTTVISISSRGKSASKKSKTEEAAVIGRELAKRAMESNIKNAVFDRGKYAYHGRVKALCEGAREGGLQI